MSDRLLNVADYERAARERLDPSAFDYIAGGAGDEVTLAGNVAAYDQWRLRPRVLAGVADRDLSVTLLGDKLSLPIGVAPTAFHRLAHPDGELATARAAGAAATLMIVSAIATEPLEAVAAAASNPLWFQTYLFKDRALTADLAQRAHAAGYRALVLTLDTPVRGRRERELRPGFALPPGIAMANLRRPAAASGGAASPMMSFGADQFDPALTWRDVETFIQAAPLPVLVKGVLHPADARLAAQAGAAGVIVSNHGGRQLDGALATLDALPEVAAALSDTQLPVIMDGGVRRGTDVVVALALGAKLVLLGRPILWGLAVDGAAGAQQVLELLRRELDTALALLGCPRAADLNPDFLFRRPA